MPIYEFQCETCDNRFEKLVLKGDEKYFVCPECNGTQVKKVMSASSFINSGLGPACGAGSSGGFS